MPKNQVVVSFLLGAGASYGHINEAQAETPPVMRHFLSTAAKQGELTVGRFPDLANACLTRANTKDLEQACRLMEATGKDLETFLGSLQDLVTLQMAYFFLHRYMGRFCNSALAKDSAYRRFAQFISTRRKTTVGGVISMNYDILGDRAVTATLRQINYCMEPTTNAGFLYLKPHGSVNFRFPIGQFVNSSVNNWNCLVNAHSSFLPKNRFKGLWVQSFPPSFDFELDFLTDGSNVKTGRLEFVPAIVPPFGAGKDYVQFPFENVWAQTRSLLGRTDTLIVIGCAMNEADAKLWQVVSENLRKETVIKVVSANQVEAKSVCDKFSKKGFKNPEPVNANGFYDYTHKYLDPGRV